MRIIDEVETRGKRTNDNGPSDQPIDLSSAGSNLPDLDDSSVREKFSQSQAARLY